jgi:hypothetical protein
MIYNSIKNLSALMVFSVSMQAFAHERINVQIKTNVETVAAIGFKVEDKKSGARGNSHSGVGPINKKYIFGYRKSSIFGPDILCGSQILSKDAVVTIVIQGEHCSIKVD